MLTLRKCVNVLKWFYTHRHYLIIWYLKESIKYLDMFSFIMEWEVGRENWALPFLFQRMCKVWCLTKERALLSRDSGLREALGGSNLQKVERLQVPRPWTSRPQFEFWFPHSSLLLSPSDLLSSYLHVWAPEEDLASIVQKSMILCALELYSCAWNDNDNSNHRTA